MSWIGPNWLPRSCLLCRLQPGSPVCADCHRDFFLDGAERCYCCALRLPLSVAANAVSERRLCGRCAHDSPSFDATVCLGDYRSPLDGIVLALKFGHRLEVATALGRLLADTLIKSTDDTTLVLPVPLTFERQAERGFNQAYEIARTAARHASRQLLTDALIRVRHGPAQESLSAKERYRNVQGAFSIAASAGPSLTHRTVAVVDDVMTSGSTLEEIARVLKEVGVRHITNVVVARTP